MEIPAGMLATGRFFSLSLSLKNKRAQDIEKENGDKDIQMKWLELKCRCNVIRFKGTQS